MVRCCLVVDDIKLKLCVVTHLAFHFHCLLSLMYNGYNNKLWHTEDNKHSSGFWYHAHLPVDASVS
jgi:hypothetical protein